MAFEEYVERSEDVVFYAAGGGVYDGGFFEAEDWVAELARCVGVD